MNILWFLLIGLIAGWLAGKVIKGSSFGLIGNMIVGVIGALIGGFLFGQMGVSTSGLIGEILAATVGAIILLLILRLVPQKRF
ncbi:MAG TPA: GlsB/YeaQ/YmgE family stress response membrane protein [Gemmataceae bacterium]|jgi:uncharacterized membrane protein YeaQ/YmgE (transglycosylase-associated protein family)